MYYNLYKCCDKGKCHNMIEPKKNNVKKELRYLYPDYDPIRKMIVKIEKENIMIEKTVIEYKRAFYSFYLDLNNVIEREKNNIDIENLQELQNLSNFLLSLNNELNAK